MLWRRRSKNCSKGKPLRGVCLWIPLEATFPPVGLFYWSIGLFPGLFWHLTHRHSSWQLSALMSLFYWLIGLFPGLFWHLTHRHSSWQLSALMSLFYWLIGLFPGLFWHLTHVSVHVNASKRVCVCVCVCVCVYVYVRVPTWSPAKWILKRFSNTWPSKIFIFTSPNKVKPWWCLNWT